jgi:hypothetical protein
MMVTIVAMVRLGRAVLMFALAMAFAMHAPIACAAVHQNCHQSSRSAAPLSCCATMSCLSAVDAHHDVVTPAPSLVTSVAPALVAYLAPRPPLAEITFASAKTTSPPPSTPLVIELQTLLI